MIRAVKGDRNALAKRFGISPKLATRIEAMASRELGVTRQVLEASRPGSPTEAVLLDAKLLRAAATLDDARLAEITQSAAGLRAGQVPAMRVVHRAGTKIIALGTELAELKDADLLPAAARTSGLSLRVLGGAEAAALFSREDILRLKLVIITSTNEDEKVTAIRQLVLVPAEPREKGAPLLRALSDESARVRSEAAKALVSLGLTPDIADAARSLAQGNESQRVLAAQRIASLIGGVSESEMGVLLALLAGSLAGEESTPVRVELVTAARAAAAGVCRRQEHAAEMVRLLLDQVRTGVDALRRPVQDALADLGAHAPQVVGELCWQELTSIRENTVRRFLLSGMSRIELSPALRRQVAGEALHEILASPRPEEDCMELGSLLCRWPKESAEPMLDVIETASDAAKLFLVRLLDELASRDELSDKLMERLGRAFLRLLQVSEKNVRPAVLLSGAIHSARLSPELRREIAAEMLAGLHDYGSVRMLDAIGTSITRIGVPALEPLCDLIRSDARLRERTLAARMLGNTVAAIPRGRNAAAVAKQTISTAIELLDDSRAPRGAIASALGRMCTNPMVDAETLDGVAGQLTQRVKLGPEAYGVLEGLGALVLNPAAPLRPRLEIVQRFFDLLNSALPDVETQETVVDEQRVYSFGGDVSAYTEMVPIALHGLENSFLGTDSGTIRERITRFLIGKWAEISSWETIWGPENVIVLLRVLGTIACHRDTPMDMKIDIIDAVTKRIDLMPVIETLGSVYRTEPGSVRIGAKARDLAWLLIERRLPKRSLLLEDRQVMQQVLGIIGSRSSLGADPSLARRTRERIVEVLFGGLRDGHSSAASALAIMRDCPALPSSVRKDIADRVAGFEAAHTDKVPYRPKIKAN